MIKTSLFPLIGILLILTGCSMEKRLYTRGYNLNWRRNHSGSTAQPKTRKQYPNAKIAQISENENSLTASGEAGHPTQSLNNIYNPQEIGNASDDSCDMIVLKNNKYILAKVKELNPDYIVFKKCGDPKGRDCRIPTSKLSKIIFADSSLQPVIFQKGQPEPQRDANYASDSTKVRYRYVKHSVSFGGFSILAFIIACGAGYLVSIFFPITLVGLLFWFIIYCVAIAAVVVSFVFAILAIAYALKSLKKIFKSPKKFTGEKEAYTGLSIGITIFTLLAIAGFLALYLY